MNSKITPGPWIVEKNVEMKGISHLAVTNRAAAGDWFICSVTPMRLARDVDYAHAAAISAVPEMIAALQRLPIAAFDKEDIDAAEFVDHSQDFVEAMRLAKEALKKAGVL